MPKFTRRIFNFLLFPSYHLINAEKPPKSRIRRQEFAIYQTGAVPGCFVPATRMSLSEKKRKAVSGL